MNIINVVDFSANSVTNSSSLDKEDFVVGNCLVCGNHGIGRLISIEFENISGFNLEFLVIEFENDKMTIKIPKSQIEKNKVRPLSSVEKMEEASHVLRRGIKKVKGMWSRRAKEYEEKIHSGDVLLLAEVLSDLIRDVDDADRSYSERIIYDTALERFALEYSLVYNLDFEVAKNTVINTAKNKLSYRAKKDEKTFEEQQKELEKKYA